MSDYYRNFDWLFSDTAEEYIKKKEQEDLKLEKECKEYIKKIEDAGVCEHCGEKGKIRWVDDGEFYSCYECFLYNLKCWADVMVPSRNVDNMEGFMEEEIWDSMLEEDK